MMGVGGGGEDCVFVGNISLVGEQPTFNNNANKIMLLVNHHRKPIEK